MRLLAKYDVSKADFSREIKFSDVSESKIAEYLKEIGKLMTEKSRLEQVLRDKKEELKNVEAEYAKLSEDLQS
jgi:predicted  nucleic acid-binding Zn-ribbon protein